MEGGADVRKAKRKSENLKTRKVGRSCERLETAPSQALPRAWGIQTSGWMIKGTLGGVLR